jgi:UDPglucose 6-dehydrogenase
MFRRGQTVNLCVAGVGYVGLVAATCLAESGNDVVAVDSDRGKIERLKQGEIPIYEPGLKELIGRNVREGRLRFATDLAEAVRAAEVVFIAVGTPSGPDGAADLSAVTAVAREIGRNLSGYKLVVIKSTVPVGTAEDVEEIIRTAGEETRAAPPVEFEVANNPEFMKEGAAVDDFMRPDRVVVGVASERAAEILRELYAPFVRTEKPILVMDRRSAEMTKYVSNAMLATKISFINEMANLCEHLGADIAAVRRGIGFDSRIGFQFLFPGLGYGGSCFPKDVDALILTAAEHNYPARILRAVQAVNTDQKRALADKVRSHFGDRIAGTTLALWGLAFKPQTDDMREAPSREIVRELMERGARFRVHDPVAMSEARKIFGEKLIYCDNPYAALEGASALLIATEWPEFRRPNFQRIKELLREPVIFDGRNLYEPEVMAKWGFTYYSIGRKPVQQT